MRLGFFSFAAFFAALYAFITVYINSTAALTLGEAGLLFTFLGSACITAYALYVSPSLLTRLGNRRFMLLWCAIALSALVGLIVSTSPFLFGLSLIIHLSCGTLIGYSLDIFFERGITNTSTTGTARGIYMTTGNVALVGAPVIAGFLVAHGGLDAIYYAAGLALCIFIVLINVVTWRFTDPHYGTVSLMGYVRTLEGPVGPVILCQLVLRIFYAWAILFMPLYLIQVAAFSWQEVGIIIGIGLLPFALFELALGKIADRYIGEKEMLIVGLIILGLSTVLFALPLPHTVFIAGGIFFISRVGAAMVEIATEANFFRLVTAEHADAITLFRSTQPLSTLVGVSTGAALLLVVPLSYVFGIFGALVLFGLLPALKLIDSR